MWCIPSSRPVLAALTLITVVSQWNNFMWPLVITSGHKWRVLTVATADLQSRFNSQWTLVMAATTIAIVPLIVLFVAVSATHRRFDRRLGAQMTAAEARRFSQRWSAHWRCVPMVAVVLVGRGATARVLLNYSGQPAGDKIVVTVRIWAQPIAAAYRESFEAFNRAHPDIEVHINMVAYSTYFNTLRTDVAGGSADDIFWLSNAYLAAYADSGRLLNIGKTLGPVRPRRGSRRWSTSSPAAACCGVCRS